MVPPGEEAKTFIIIVLRVAGLRVVDLSAH